MYNNRPYSYSRQWTGTSLQVRLMWGVFSNANDINPILMMFPRMSLHCKLVPVQYQEYEYGLFDHSLYHLFRCCDHLFHIIFFRETKIVLKGNNSAHLFDLEDLAIKAHVPHYLVHDAGKTQVCTCMP